MDATVSIQVSADKRRAWMCILSQNATEADVGAELKNAGVVEHILWDVIRASLSRARSAPLANTALLIAQSDPQPQQAQFLTRTIAVSPASYRQLQQELLEFLHHLRTVSSGGTIEGTLPPGVFVREGEVILHEHPPVAWTDILGAPLPLSLQPPPALKTDRSIAVTKTPQGLEYTARYGGYLIAQDEGSLSILEPSFVSGDKMVRYFSLLPLWHGADALLEAYEQSSRTTITELATKECPSLATVYKVVQQSGHGRIVVQRGVAVQSGVDGQLDILITPSTKPIIQSDGSVDQKQLSPYREVEAGSVIARKKSPQPGKDGLTVNGEILSAKPVKDIALTIGPNIIAHEENGIVEYRARITGILKQQESFIDILELLHIKDDVAQQTGNLQTNKCILIEGSIYGGFSVESSADIFIRGSVENGAIVKCGGMLVVEQGIFGDKTSVVAQGEASIGFIQNSHLEVASHLTVHSFVYDSTVRCGGILTVEGRVGTATDTRGCVLGGKISAFQSMTLASVGSRNEKTYLFCGVDPVLLETVDELSVRIATLNKHTTRLRSSMGIDFDAPDATLLLRALPPARKQQIKTVLLQLKEIAKKQAQYQKVLPLLQKKALNPNLSSCRIVVQKYLVPDVAIQIGRQSKTILHPLSRFLASYDTHQGIMLQV